MIPDHDFDDYRDRRVLVMGLGSFGGGVGAVKFLVERGAVVTVTDIRPAEKLVESLAELNDCPPDRLVLGGHNECDFSSTELIVVNPAVKRDCPFLNIAIRAGIPTTSEMNLFWKWNQAPVIAITGSNGKSTTTALTYSIVEKFLEPQHNRRAWLGGNIGASLLPLVDRIHSNDIVVLELSSFQLADLDRMRVSPHIAIVTNFAPNHLDWHSDLQDYRRAKQTILRWQTSDDIAVLNSDDDEVRSWTTLGERLEFGVFDRGKQGAFRKNREVLIRTNAGEEFWPLMDWLKLPGGHNVANALAAIAASISVGTDADCVKRGIESYVPLPHRLEFVGEVNGRRFYNDSLATTPESTAVALDAFEAPIILLAGGYDKHVDLTLMADKIARGVKAASLMGQTAIQLQKLISSAASTQCQISPPQLSFVDAFAWAIDHSTLGDVILLSPGCASYDWFRNYLERGQQFKALVQTYSSSIL